MNNIESTFNKIYDETYDKVFKYIISKCDDLSYVNDIIQDVYEIIKRKGADYIKNTSFIYTLTKRKIFRYYRFKNKFKTIFSIDFNFSYLDNESNKLDNLATAEIEE